MKFDEEMRRKVAAMSRRDVEGLVEHLMKSLFLETMKKVSFCPDCGKGVD